MRGVGCWGQRLDATGGEAGDGGVVRVIGVVGQFTRFDLVLLILIGNAVQNGLNGGDNSLTAAAILSGCLIGLNYLVVLLSARYPPVRELVSRADFDKAMREAVNSATSTRRSWKPTATSPSSPASKTK